MKRKYVIYALAGYAVNTLILAFYQSDKGEPFLTEEAAADFLTKKVSQYGSCGDYTILPIYSKE